MKRVAEETVRALLEGNFDDLGELIKNAGEIQRGFHPSVTPQAVERLSQIGRSHGTQATKMAGAGGGGCVYFLCVPERKQELQDALEADGIQVLPVEFPQIGVKTDASIP